MINNITNIDNPLTKNEYLKLVFTNEEISKNTLINRASQFWWLNRSNKIICGGYNSSHFGLKRYLK